MTWKSSISRSKHVLTSLTLASEQSQACLMGFVVGQGKWWASKLKYSLRSTKTTTACYGHAMMLWNLSSVKDQVSYRVTGYFCPRWGRGWRRTLASFRLSLPPPLPPLFNSRQEALKTQVISLLTFFSISEIYMLVKKVGSVYIEFISEKKGHFSQVFIKVSVTLIKCKDLDF